MSSVPPIQDMPPPGGYSKIVYERVPPRVIFTGSKLIVAFVIMQFSALYLKFKFVRPVQNRRKLEVRSSALAITPFLMAERDRATLINMRRSRDCEAKLMKDVEGWEVGTYMGEPIFKTMGSNEWPKPKFFEHYMHSDPSAEATNRNCRYRR